MERLKRLRKELSNRILEEEEKKDNHQQKKASVKRSTNEANFKAPGQTTPTKRNRGSNISANSTSKQNASNIS